MPDQAASTANDFVISRVLDAPCDLVWQCFTDQEHMMHWWGPKGFKVIAANMDLRVGGTFHYGMTAPNGAPMWGLFQFHEIVPQEKLVFANSFSDEKGGVTRHPGHEKWPLQMLSTFSFEDAPGAGTRFTVHWRPLNATPEEQATFDSDQSRVSMTNGWTGTMEQLEAYLEKAE